MLVVFVGRPGTGKTTLARLTAGEFSAAHLRIDAIEAAVIRSGLARPPLGRVGYEVAHEVAASCLSVGTTVVVDAVSPVSAARASWLALARSSRVPARMIEVVVSDPREHRRRVEARRSDVAGLIVPTWMQVMAVTYEAWDATRDGPRLVVANDGSPGEAMVRVRAYLSRT